MLTIYKKKRTMEIVLCTRSCDDQVMHTSNVSFEVKIEKASQYLLVDLCIELS